MVFASAVSVPSMTKRWVIARFTKDLTSTVLHWRALTSKHTRPRPEARPVVSVETTPMVHGDAKSVATMVAVFLKEQQVENPQGANEKLVLLAGCLFHYRLWMK